MQKILVIGSINMDYVIQVNEMPVAGETILCKDFECIPGGKGANQAYAVGRLGGRVSMLGAVGNDPQGAKLLGNLNSANVDTSRIKTVSRQSGTAFICVNKDGDNSIIVIQGANQAVDTEYIMENLDIIEQSDIVILQLEIPLNTVLFAAQTAKAMGKTVILDPAPAPKELPRQLYACVDYIKPNELELETLTGKGETPEAAAKLLIEKGVKNAVVSLGSKGSILVDSPGCCTPVAAVTMGPVVDTTAAGDSFTAAFALCLSQGKTPVSALEFAAKVSGIVVTRKGAQSSIPTAAELDALSLTV